jgi:hypothetical protein
VIIARPALGSAHGTRLTEHRVRDGRAGDRDRVELIFGQVHKALRDPEYRRRVVKTVSHCRSRDEECELAALFSSSDRAIRYMPDPYGKDTYATPMATRDLGAGDCDDHSADEVAQTLIAGFPSGVRTIAPDNDTMGHIYGIVAVPRDNPSRIVAMDSSMTGLGATVGWQPRSSDRRVYQDWWYSEDENGKPVVQLGEGSYAARRWPWVLGGIVLLAAIGTVVVLVVRRPR